MPAVDYAALVREMPCKRLAPGAYCVTDTTTGRSVAVYAGEMLDPSCCWIARAEWTRDLYTDPCSTKRSALVEARLMLLEARPVT